MREIKLQLVWQGAIYEPLTIQELAWGQWEIEGKMYEDNENNGNKKGDYVSIPRKDYLFFSQDENDFGIWRQFTGLLDKNRKEIYEGDIVRWYGDKVHKEDPYFGIVKFSDDYVGFQVVYDNKLGNNGYNGISRSPKIDTQEIIGNIYENSGLIK